jgi:hypothetical protein
VSVYYL